MDDLRREFVRLRQRIDRIEEDISKIKFEHRRIAVVVNNGAESSHRQLIGLMEAVGTLGSKVYAIEDDLNNVDKEMADVTEKRLHDPGGSIPYDEARDQLPFIMKVAGDGDLRVTKEEMRSTTQECSRES